MAGSSKSGAPKRPFREQKKQMRLQFSPLPSSSPGNSKAVQDRLAAVTYEGAGNSSPAKDEPSPDPISLLSPETSSQVQVESEKTEEMSSRNAFPSSPTRHRVTRIQLSDEEDEDDLISPAQKRRKISDGSPSVPTPRSIPQRRSGRLHQGSSSPLKALALDSSEDEVDGLPSSPPRRSSRRLRQRESPKTVQLDGSEQSHSDALPDATSPTNQRSTFSDLGSPETSDDDVVMVTKPTLRRKSRLDADDPFVVNNDELQELSDKERPARTPKRKQSKGDDFIVDDDDVEYISSDDDDDGNIARKSTKSRRRSSTHTAPAKHRLRTQQEQEELEDDLQDLQDSEQETPRTQARTRGGPVTTQKDKTREHLELLKRRRAGERITRIADSDDDFDEEPRGADIDFIGEPNYDVSEEGSTVSETESDAREQGTEHEENEDDFIEDDTEGRLGRPHSDIPLQFTSFASKKPKELFIHILEWMVKNKLAPAFNREDPVYNLAFSRVDDQVKAQAGSRLISSAWGNDFKHTILARPNMKVVALPGLDEEHMRTCDACNRVNNPARYEFVFSGEPYHKKTLEPVDNSDDDEDEENDDTNDITYDEAGHVIASEDTCFYLGRFCAANAEMGHKLTHWKYHLNESLMEYLESQGVLSADAIVAREKMNKKKREKEAENIVDSMDETGVIDDFWKDFENDLNDARLGMVDYEKKGGRTRGRVGAIRTKSGGLMREWDKGRYRTMVIQSDSEGE